MTGTSKGRVATTVVLVGIILVAAALVGYTDAVLGIDASIFAYGNN